jgi:hypothetical protein
MELLHRYHVTEFVSDISFAALYPDGHENPRALPGFNSISLMAALLITFHRFIRGDERMKWNEESRR